MAVVLLSEWRQRLYRWRELLALQAERRALHRRGPVRRGHAVGRRLLIVPSDPWTLVGAKGDEAMMQSVVGRLRQAWPALRVSVVTGSAQAEQAARDLGFDPLPAWTVDLVQAAALIDALDPDGLVLLGADVLDGYYSASTAIRMLALADLAARRGTAVSILGFSFNSQPSRHLRAVFDALHPGVGIHLRDQTSMDRFAAFSAAPHQLVADSAFMLEPQARSPRVVAIGAWTQSRRAAGDRVIGFNLHPMLLRHATEGQVQALVDSAVEALREVHLTRPTSWLLLSHDYRGQDGDDRCLQAVHAALANTLGQRLLYPTERMSAAELKAVAGQVDGVVTGRMHLAIAALGMGVPVAALTYQDKFQGLFRHFDLPQDLLLSAEDCLRAPALVRLLLSFLERLPALRANVVRLLPAVLTLSQVNLDPLMAGSLCGTSDHVGSAATG
jgi:polysaccharide pyruvyl transferase WcaK-like protein